MTIRKVDFPLMDKKVKVTNERYQDGGYIGIISGISRNSLLIEFYTHLDESKGISNSDGFENFNNCELIN